MTRLFAAILLLTLSPSTSSQDEDLLLWIGYKLPEDAALAADARNLISKCISSRAVCTQACRQGTQDAACPAQCEIAFRECAVAVQGTKFWLAGCARSQCGNGVRTLFPILPRETVDPVLNSGFPQVQPNRFSPTGLAVTLGERCVFTRSSDGASVTPPESAGVCAAVKLALRSSEPATIAAAASGDVATAKFLLDRGAGIDVKDGEGRTPLHAAVTKIQMVRLLLDHGADPNAGDADGATPLHRAAIMESALGSDEGVVNLLIARGADPNARNSSGDTPLHFAAYEGSRSACDALVKAGADVNAKDNRGQTPFALAKERGHTRVALCIGAAGGR